MSALNASKLIQDRTDLVTAMTPSEIASYLVLLLRSTHASSPFLHLVASPGAERDSVISAFLGQIGGGHFLTPRRAPDHRLSFETVLALLRKSPNVAIEDGHFLVRLGISVEAIRREVATRNGAFLIVSDDVSGLDDLGLEGDPRGVVRALLRPADLRVAVAADWQRGQIRIPRDGSRPEFLSRDSGLGARVQRLAGALIQDIIES